MEEIERHQMKALHVISSNIIFADALTSSMLQRHFVCAFLDLANISLTYFSLSFVWRSLGTPGLLYTKIIILKIEIMEQNTPGTRCVLEVELSDSDTRADPYGSTSIRTACYDLQAT